MGIIKIGLVLFGGLLFLAGIGVYVDYYKEDFSVSIPFVLEELKREVSLPEPLRVSSESQSAFLTRLGILKATNNERLARRLEPLTENKQLDVAALNKAKDMLARQYFAHESPLGKNASDLVEEQYYEYIAVGENLALGNFENDEILVTAWMNSPGHRANILSEKFDEIGIGIVEGEFEGKITWLAVQIFAKPLSACPVVNNVLKTKIETMEKQISLLKQDADALYAELSSYGGSRRSEEYRQKAQEYNSLVAQINALVDTYKGFIVQYNDQVMQFNACVQSS